MNRLTLCADDFAFSPDDSRVIADLLRGRRLNATGCMTVRPNWPTDRRLLDDVPPDAEIGLHLVLTQERPLTGLRLGSGDELPAINDLHRLTRERQVPLDPVATEIEAQFDRFEQAMDRPPAFVDGHQHAHALPGIRDVVLAAIARRAPGAWVRSCEERLPAMLARPFRGKALASAVHSRGLAAAALRMGLRANRGFAGHYGFAGDYRALLPRFLRRPGARHLVMCHPGAGTRAGDAIAAARAVEADALRAMPIAELAAAHGLFFAA